MFVINLYGITVGESISYPNIRKETTLKNFKYKVLISFLVFVAVAVITIVLTRATDEVRSSKENMSAATLPVVYMISEGGQEFNLLHGYVSNIDESMLHECITPLPEGRKLRIGIGTYGQKITGISYEIRSLERLRVHREHNGYGLSDSGICR